MTLSIPTNTVYCVCDCWLRTLKQPGNFPMSHSLCMQVFYLCNHLKAKFNPRPVPCLRSVRDPSAIAWIVTFISVPAIKFKMFSVTIRQCPIAKGFKLFPLLAHFYPSLEIIFSVLRFRFRRAPAFHSMPCFIQTRSPHAVCATARNAFSKIGGTPSAAFADLTRAIHHYPTLLSAIHTRCQKQIAPFARFSQTDRW